MKIIYAKAAANLIRVLYKLKLISFELMDRKIDELTVRVFKEEIDNVSSKPKEK
jgi:hypothetical protein